MTNKELNILYQFDDNYAPYAGISILSLFVHNKEIEHLNVYCATMNVSQKNIELLDKTAEKYCRKIQYLNTEKSQKQIEKFNVGTWNGSLATWIKVFIIEDLIGRIDRLLYVDSDTLIMGSLETLCDMDFHGNAMACVIDSLAFEHVKRLGLKKTSHYYNAGVMYFNLKYFYENDSYYNEMIEHLKKNVERYIVNDQDLLNDYFEDKILTMPPAYNMQGTHYMYSDKVYFGVYGKYDYYSISDIVKAKEDVKIVHFFRVLGDYPWEQGNMHPLKKEFEKWKNRSLWKEYELPNKKRSLIFKIERILYRCMPRTVFIRIFKWITNM